MSRKKNAKRGATQGQAAAGRRNLAGFNQAVLSGAAPPPNLRHGLYSLIKTGSLPVGQDDIAHRVDAIIGAMVSDLGCSSEAELPAQKRAIIAGQRLALLVLNLAEGYLREQGLLDKRGRPHPLLSTVVSFINCTRLGAVSLGLERKPRHVVPTLEAIRREYAVKATLEAKQ